MTLSATISNSTCEAISKLYGETVEPEVIQVQKTRKEFEGDITLVVFPLLKVSKKSPEKTCKEIGEYLQSNVEEVAGFNVIKGFLNLIIGDAYWLGFLKKALTEQNYGFTKENSGKIIMIEYSCPNTNKPLHLGHIRNNLLGHSLSEILQANGHQTIKVNLINDRGVHICKSMLSWQKWGNGETPESSGIKGDKLVGKYYVEFEKHYKKEMEELIAKGMSKEEAQKNAPLIKETQEMLRKWEAKDSGTIDLWKKMNEWVYEGFDKTYEQMGVDFDKNYYESNTYLLGKEIVEKSLKKRILFKKKDGSIWCDLSKESLDDKLLLRSDGTSVYMTQDIGTAVQRFSDFTLNKHIYIVGNEQDYHFRVLFIILKKMGYDWADECHHLSYGMVDLTSGKMKSREGTVVDADDLMEEMIETAKKISEELGKLDEYSDKEKEKLYQIIGLGALKYFILKVDPKKQMLFNPEESIDFNGNTGPFIQYTYARIQSVLRKAASPGSLVLGKDLGGIEKELIKLIYEYPAIVKEAGETYSPAVIANYVYELAKEYNQFYQEVPILQADKEELVSLRLTLSKMVGEVIKSSMKMLGIDAPERM